MRSSRSSAPPPRRPRAGFDAEIVPVTATMTVKDKETGEVSQKEVTLAKDEGNRAGHHARGPASLQPVLGPDTHDHRRQRQPAVSDGARPAS